MTCLRLAHDLFMTCLQLVYNKMVVHGAILQLILARLLLVESVQYKITRPLIGIKFTGAIARPFQVGSFRCKKESFSTQ